MIDVVFVPQRKISEDTCVLIDVLRATSVIVTALANGAVRVKPVLTVQQALKQKDADVLICGERKSVKPKGFDLGNSPLEYSKRAVEGKNIVLTTTNGTRAIGKIKCKRLYAASFLNLSAVVRKLELHDRVTIVCAGQKGRVALEDVLCAGAIVSMSRAERKTDSALMAESVWKSVGSIFKALSECQHGKELIEKGFSKDVEFCSKIDLYHLVPVFKDGAFSLDE
ncbi:2-phosphosulfolactate phosphatase family protein [Pseudothermotoga sp.]|nr:2-phosphosulfolactate phosphatase family protein [Pseudothermotoga sp.]MDW8139816.1 2-phosphosulfolactate phosphatase family protein [Pseudothermotoga sp.]